MEKWDQPTAVNPGGGSTAESGHLKEADTVAEQNWRRQRSNESKIIAFRQGPDGHNL
jgi:hypothetical protein